MSLRSPECSTTLESPNERKNDNPQETAKPLNILIVEPDADAAKLLPRLLPWGFYHMIVQTLEEAEAILDANPPGVLICADDLLEETGLMFFSRTQNRWEKTKRILMAPSPDGEFFFLSVRETNPPYALISKPVNKQELSHVIHRLLSPHPVKREGVEKRTPSPSVESANTEPQKKSVLFGLVAGSVAILIILVLLVMHIIKLFLKI